MRYFILALFTLSFLYAADEPKPAEVLNAYATFEKVVIEQHKKFDPVIKKAQDDAMSKLQAAKLAMTKMGDLKGALAIEAEIAKLSNGEILAMIEGKIKENANVFGNMDIVGKWRGKTGPYIREFFPDGNVTHSGGAKGTWKIVNKNILATWSDGSSETYIMPIKDNVINQCIKSSGVKFELIRVP